MKEAREKINAGGMKLLKFSQADADRFLKMANDAGWENVKTAASAEYETLRKFFKGGVISTS